MMKKLLQMFKITKPIIYAMDLVGLVTMVTYWQRHLWLVTMVTG